MLINFIRYLLHYLPEILLVLPILLWGYLELRTERRWIIAMRVMVSVAMVAAAAVLLTGYPLAPHHNWSNCRLAPAISWVKGYQLYSYPDDGPMLVQMYGPVSAMVYTPAALAGRPTTAVLIGAAINTLLYILPAAWFLIRARRGQHLLFAAAAMAGFLLFSGRQFVLKEAATLVTIDAPAVGFATCALAVLAGSSGRDMLRTGAICGIFAALAIWTKLTLAPIVFAMAIYVLFTDGLRGALRFIGGMAISGFAITGIFLICFGMPLLFQNVLVPSRQPWQWERLGRGGAYLRAIRSMWRDALPIGWLAIAGMLLSIRLPRLEPASLRQWSRDNPWLLLLLAGIAVIPTSALAYVKYGGSWNNGVAPWYLILLATAAALSGACGASEEPSLSSSRRFGRVALATFLILACWMGPATLRTVRDGLLTWRDLNLNENEAAFRYLKAHPGEGFFPSLPLAALLAEGRLYHFDAGIDSLHLAGYPLSDEQLRAHLPQKMRAVLYRKDSMIPALMTRLTEFDLPAPDPAMPDWNVMTRDGVAP